MTDFGNINTELNIKVCLMCISSILRLLPLFIFLTGFGHDQNKRMYYLLLSTDSANIHLRPIVDQHNASKSEQLLMYPEALV